MYFAKKKKKRGFTLIELLVVIAIIGILATIVVVNVNSARNKANDVAIKAALDQVRTQAELYYDSAAGNNTYNGLTIAVPAPEMGIIATAITNNGGTVFTVNEIDTAYCAQAVLKSSGAGSWCVDSTGYAGPIANCDTVAATCAL